MTNDAKFWIIAHLILILLVYVGFVEGVIVIQEFVVAAIWVLLFYYTYALSSKLAVRRLRSRGRPVPRPLIWIVDLIVFGMLLQGEGYMTSLAYASSCIIVEAIYRV